MIDKNYIFRLAKTDEKPIKGLTWEKEVIYVGSFVAPQPDGSSQKFSVSEDDLKHWKQSIELQLSRGIRIDLPLGHTTNPEASRGKIVGADVRENSRGLPSLWVTVEFADEKAAELAKTAEVSLYSPPSWQDGFGNTYSRPIRHVALTQQPVISNLDAFTLIASLDEGSQSMDYLMQIADAIGLEAVDGEDEAALTQRILDAITAEEDPEDTGEDDPMLDGEDLGEDLGEGGDPTMDMSFSHREVLEGRKARVALLLSQGKITPAQQKKLESTYCAKGSLALSNEFDSAIQVLSLSESRKPGSRTGAQLSKTDGPTLSPLVADAERRAKAGGN